MQVNLDQLAQKLGTTVDKLISVYVKLVPVLWYKFFVVFAFALVALVLLCFIRRKVVKTMQVAEAEEGEVFVFARHVASLLCFAVVYFIVFGVGVLFLDAVRASASPEAYALDQIFSKIR